MADRILILQPTIPPYREWLIDRLLAHYGPRLQVVAGETEPDGTKTARRDDPRLLITGRARRIGGAVWQSGVPWRVFARRYRAVVMVGNLRYLNLYLWLPWCWLTGARVLFWTHLGLRHDADSWGQRFRLAVLKRIDCTLLYTEAEQQRALAAYGLRNVTGLNNTIDTDEVLASMGGEAGWRRAIEARSRGEGACPAIVLFCGRVTAKARLPLLIEALARARAAGASMRLWVVGDGPQREAAMQLARDLHVGEHIDWHAATYDAAELARHFLGATFMVYPGNVGLSLLHAFAYGLPALIHDNRAAHMPEADALVPGTNGATFAEDDSDSLAREMRRMVSSGDDYRRMQEGAFATAYGAWSGEHMTARYIAALDAACRREQQPGCVGALERR